MFTIRRANALSLVLIALQFLAVPCVRANVAGAVPLDHGWRLWLDKAAQWQNDPLFLPEDVKLGSMPVNPPTGGWSALSDKAGIAVSLPATVEQFYWGKTAGTASGPESAAAIVEGDGSYRGVSWWYRTFTVPALKPGERLVFHFPGARLRAEVYVNGKLVGYNIISEAPFSADATSACHPGAGNLLAVRITNPGGRIDWMDFQTMNWGNYVLPATHSFGGLDGGVEMQVRSDVSVSDLAVFNTPDTHTVRIRAKLTSHGSAYEGPLEIRITQAGRLLFETSQPVSVPSGGDATAWVEAKVPAALLWAVGQPHLCEATATLPPLGHSDRSTTFGFRWFGVRGLGTDATLCLNGHRIVPISSISWGFWAPNGIFPDKAAVAREIASMKALGLDSLQNHRHMPKAAEVDGFNRAGLLLYCEAGGGVFTFEKAPTEPKGTSVEVRYDGKPLELDFLNRYQLDKELAMIRAFRSDPCVTIWTLQNETGPDVDNPRMRYALERMREADPSRLVLLKSGEVSRGEVWSLPYSTSWMKDDGTGYSGWWDEHTAMNSPGVWVDSMYQSPTNYAYRSDDRKEVVVWGEMATGASPDDHTAIVRWYKRHHETGYDLAAHEALRKVYDRFIDEHGFRAAFPTAEDLFREAGAKHYFSAAHLLENARMCNTNDYIVLSGWESTTIDDHSGLVDALRQLKASPKLLHAAAQPEVLVIRPRQHVLATGDTAVVDVHQINDRNMTGTWKLGVTAAYSGQAPFFQASTPVTLIGGDTFGQLLKAGIEFKVDRPGSVQIRATLSPVAGGAPVLENEEPLLVVDPQPRRLGGEIACLGDNAALIPALKGRFHADAVPFTPGLGKVPTILLATQSASPEGWLTSDSNAPVAGTKDPELYKHQMWGKAGPIHTWTGLAPGKVVVKIHLEDGFSSGPGQRLFDIALNGKVVARNLDIFARAGGSGRALVETYVVDAPKGAVAMSVPHVSSDNATLAAVELRDSAGRVVRAVFRNQRYVDPKGNVWTPISDQHDAAWTSDLSAVLKRVRDDGTRLVLLTTGGDDAQQLASYLGEQGLLRYSGPAAASGPSWMGFWYFGRKHWLLDGLPSNCVLDWPYQITNGNGLLLDGPGVETVIGYGKDHDPNIGVSAAVVRCGKGRIVLLALPGLKNSFVEDASLGFQKITAERILFNALAR